ncbi:glycoside hydrolase/phage tail family protein [Maricaulis sp.]|uniref:baseplate multidomain protein megatron n=1 Tax=Maricaulis sp. TaxID=1486257 RepID=UPI00262CB76A|nr:glycoside hydrolase/phage tail family protein [Maricaulis sp.]
MGQLLLTAGVNLGRILVNWGARYAVQWGLNTLFAPEVTGPRMPELPVQTSSDGAPMPRLWGRGRIAGQVIWASRYREAREETGGKGGPRQTRYSYSISFAVGLCEGEISGLGRIWANGALLDLSRYTARLYRGTQTQLPDAVIAATEGADAPAFRGTAYVVFEDLPLDEFGHRIPNLSFEVFRAARDPAGLERRLQGINLIPGSGEFALSPEPVFARLGPGEEQAENINNGRGLTDVLAALDDLERDLPACRSIQLIIAWFGTDLRCGACEVHPGVERRDKLTRPVSWMVAGADRQSAHLISQIGDRPVYGGTPDDAGVMALIGELKARGFRVILYPFVLMDIAPGNARPDPYGGAEQAAFPWRGRITAAGSPAVGADVAQFFGTARASDFAVSEQEVAYDGPAEWRFNRFILHCAALAKAAGGVEGFLIGSEMIGLTTSRDGDDFPAVDHLRTLAAEARQLLGPNTRLSYAADWTEYGGTGSNGEKYFHLDPLWSDPAIDAVAIDWYAPLSDWRDGQSHADAAAGSPHDRDYLAANIAGGEGFDWYYASEEDRANQDRTAITDGQGEAWIWRVKDLVSWWSSPHHDRPGGVRTTAPTGWVPMSKPVWLTEIGLPATDKGANQPNVFFDPKSAESALPHFSSGERDDLIQRRGLEALLAHWSASGPHNPVSPLYGAAMIEADWIHVWAFDARPWPDFPARSEIWADGANWRLGHWLNGRAGLVPVAEIVADIAADCAIAGVDVTAVDDLVSGYVLGQAGSGRSALAPLVELFDLSVIETASGLDIRSAGRPADAYVLSDGRVMDGGDVQVRQGAMDDHSRDTRLYYIDDSADYMPAVASARQAAGRAGVETVSAPVLADPSLAQDWAERHFARTSMARSGLVIGLPPSALGVQPGDRIGFQGQDYRITAVQGDSARTAQLQLATHAGPTLAGSQAGVAADPPLPPARPEIALIDRHPEGLLAACFGAPWSAPVALAISTDAVHFDPRGEALQPGIMGELLADLAPGPAGYWDRAGVIEVALYGGQLDSRDGRDVLAGRNRIAVEQAEGEWEVLDFARAELIGERCYRLTGLLRGQAGSSPQGALMGARLVVLDHALVPVALAAHETGLDVTLRAWPAGSAQSSAGMEVVTAQRRGLRCYAPVHLRWRRSGDMLLASWVRRTRVDGDNWVAADVPLGEAEEAYQLTLSGPSGVILQERVEQPFWQGALAALDLPASGLNLSVAQISREYGPELSARADITL